MKVWLDEFLFRGRPPDSEEPMAWHINVLATSTDAFGEETVSMRQYDMTTAEKAGYPLPDIIAGINTEVMKDCEKLRAEKIALTLALQAEIEETKRGQQLIDNLRKILGELRGVIENERAAFLAKKQELVNERHAVLTPILTELKAMQRSTKIAS